MGDVVKASSLADYLDSTLKGDNIDVSIVSSLNNIKKNSIVFATKNTFEVNDDMQFLVLVPLDYEYEANNFSVIKVNNPRLAFAKVLNNFFVKKIFGQIDKSSKIGKNCTINPTVSIGANCVIGDNVEIAAKTIINQNVVIFDNTIIGNNCYIKSGSVIGEDGFGFDFEEDGTPVRIPHLGAVTIGNNIEIGANTIIARGTIDNTILEDHVKVDDNSVIAHNCHIGEKTIITGQVAISGSVSIGKKCWIGPSSAIMQKVKIGNNVTIGIGCTINNNINDDEIYMELPSMNIKKASLVRNTLYRMVKDSKINKKEK